MLCSRISRQQLGQFAADRQAQARAAVLCGWCFHRLLERLEDDLLFLPGNADAGVRHREGDHRAGRGFSVSLSFDHPSSAGDTSSVTARAR